MPTRGCLLHLSLLALGAYTGLPARCGALDRGHIDGTFALQVQQQEGEGQSVLRNEVPRMAAAGFYVYSVELTFVMTGFNYLTLAADTEVANNFTNLVIENVCKNFTENVNNYSYDCQVTLSDSKTFTGVLVGISIDQNTSQESADAIAAELDTHSDDMIDTMVGNRAVMFRESLFSAHHIGNPIVSVGIQNFRVYSEASGSDDPHLTSVTGKKFDVNMPGSYVLIRAPQDQRLPAKLELNATLGTSPGSPCGLYIKSIDLGGEWLGDQEASVFPLQRNVDGDNGAGNSTLRPFSVRLQEVQRGALRVKAGQKWGDIDKQGRSLSGRVRLVPVWRQVYADAGRPQEAQAFHFHIRSDRGEHGATLEAAQAAHQALNIRALGLRRLGFEQLGGLLGTEEHDRSLEQFADACKAFRARSRQSSRMSPAGSSMAAFWDALL